MNEMIDLSAPLATFQATIIGAINQVTPVVWVIFAIIFGIAIVMKILRLIGKG